MLFRSVSLAVLAVMNFVGDVAVLAVPTMILIAFYILGFAVSWGPIAWVLIGEIFPLSVRGIGSSFGSAANWLIIYSNMLTMKNDIYYMRPFSIMVRFPGRFFETHAAKMSNINQIMLVISSFILVCISVTIWKRRRVH